MTIIIIKLNKKYVIFYIHNHNLFKAKNPSPPNSPEYDKLNLALGGMIKKSTRVNPIN